MQAKKHQLAFLCDSKMLCEFKRKPLAQNCSRTGHTAADFCLNRYFVWFNFYGVYFKLAQWRQRIGIASQLSSVSVIATALARLQAISSRPYRSMLKHELLVILRAKGQRFREVIGLAQKELLLCDSLCDFRANTDDRDRGNGTV
jgi:hypothetical protein